MAAPRTPAKTDTVGRNPAEPRLFDPDDQIINTKTLAVMTGRSESYYQKLRWKGGGPPYVKFGNVVGYRHSDIRAWLAANTRRSTSDDHARAVRTPDNHTIA
jgi:predicted DNA-binding transcriptional regulator AlpA